MHTFEAAHGTQFHFNPDFSGEVWIRQRDDVTAKIPAEDVAEFVAECLMRRRLQSRLEDVSWHHLIGGLPDRLTTDPGPAPESPKEAR